MTQLNIQRYARFGGLLYLFIIAAGIFGQVFVRSKLIVSGDSGTTALNILANEFLFRSGVAAELLMLIVDIALAVIFYVILRPINRNLALFAALLRVAMAAISAANLLNQMDALSWLTGTHYLVMELTMIYDFAYHSLKAHTLGYHISLVFFGFYCMFTGWLIYQAPYLPKTLGVLMIIASFSYLTNSFTNILVPELTGYLGIMILLPALVAELSLSLWLIIKGININKWKHPICVTH